MDASRGCEYPGLCAGPKLRSELTRPPSLPPAHQPSPRPNPPSTLLPAPLIDLLLGCRLLKRPWTLVLALAVPVGEGLASTRGVRGGEAAGEEDQVVAEEDAW